ncbi:MAG: NADH-quinone oxidoreductase subunit H [Deltaproteobacteria bacterium]|nr:NADH-quinone oxidoreductase subunit H [Deltaproteobacteria bacterium]
MINLPVHLFLLLVLPPFLLGVVNKTKAFLAGRKGAPFFQFYYDLFKLMRKGLVLSGTTTWVFQAGPIITLIAVLAAAALIPLGSSPALVSFTGDFLLFAYLFGLARFFTTTAALDTGSAFEGMGASREVTFAVLTEPAMFFAFLVLAKLSGSLSLAGMLHDPEVSLFHRGSAASIVMIALGFYIVFLAENSRIPVDDPNTHLELTMIHEVMVLDHSGPLLGLIEYASSLKFMVLGSVFLNLVLPAASGKIWLDWLIFITGLLGLAVSVGVIESIMARLRMSRVPSLLIVSVLLCGSAFVVLLR